MNEYYKRRYNLSNYFTKLDTILLYGLIIILILLLSIFIIIIFYENINTLTTIYVIFLIILILISYTLIKTIQETKKHIIFNNYNDYYELLNCIFKENLKFAIKKYNTFNINNSKIRQLNQDSDLYKIFLMKQELIANINNIENVYGKEANILLTNTYDIIKYYDIQKYINLNFHKRLYFDNNDLNFAKDNKIYVNKTIDYFPYIDLELLEEQDEDRTLLLNYLSKKYNKKINFLYKEPEVLFSNFDMNIDKVLDKFRRIILIYILICVFFIIIILHGLLINFNYYITYIYILIIIILMLFMYGYTFF